MRDRSNSKKENTLGNRNMYRDEELARRLITRFTIGASVLGLTAVLQPVLAGPVLVPGELVISTTTYQDTGSVAGLVAGSSNLPGSTAGTTSTAVSNGNYLTVWNNAGAGRFLRRNIAYYPANSDDVRNHYQFAQHRHQPGGNEFQLQIRIGLEHFTERTIPLFHGLCRRSYRRS